MGAMEGLLVFPGRALACPHDTVIWKSSTSCSRRPGCCCAAAALIAATAAAPVLSCNDVTMRTPFCKSEPTMILKDLHV